jgi:hypothetical protein
MDVEREISNIRCFLSFWVILPANQDGGRLSLEDGLPLMLKFSETAIAMPSHHGTMIRMSKPYDRMFSGWKWQANIEQVVDQSSKFFFGIFSIRLSLFHQSDLQKILASSFSRIFSRPLFSREITK